MGCFRFRTDSVAAVVFSFAVALLSFPKASGAIGITGVDLKFIGDSNSSKAEFSRDIETSNAFRGRVTANLLSFGEVSNDNRLSGWSVNAAASYEHNADIEGLGESRYRASLNWFRENRTARGAPFYRFGLGAEWIDSESFIRDGAQVDLSASINFQPTNFFDTTFGAQFASRQSETDVFDTQKGSVFATANFSPTPRSVLRAGARVFFGNEVSTATPSVNIVNNSEVIEPDFAFGGADARRFAYLINAVSIIGELGLGYDFSRTVQANLLYRYVTTQADGEISYDRNLVEFTLSLNF